jgi:hypothetical protein
LDKVSVLTLVDQKVLWKVASLVDVLEALKGDWMVALMAAVLVEKKALCLAVLMDVWSEYWLVDS